MAKSMALRAKMRLGSGGRFDKLETKFEDQGKSKASADAIAASIGRKKYGNKKMTSMAQAGRGC